MFRSYLLNMLRTNVPRAVVSNMASHRVLFWGPCYIVLLADVIKQHYMSYHFCADDMQIYLSFCQSAVGEPEHSRSRVKLCMKDIEQGMMINKLKLNRDKTELLVLNARHRPTPTLDSIMLELMISLHPLQQEISASGSTIWCLWIDRLLLFANLHFTICTT